MDGAVGTQLPAAASSLLPIDGGALVGTVDGQLLLYLLEPEASTAAEWALRAQLTLCRGVQIDCIASFRSSEIVASCAGRVTSRPLSPLPAFHDSAAHIAATCTGALAVQQPSPTRDALAAGAKFADRALRVCTAHHGHVSLHVASPAGGSAGGAGGGAGGGASGAGGAPASAGAATWEHHAAAPPAAAATRWEQYATVALSDPVLALHWRGISLCAATPSAYVVLDSASAATTWCLHHAAPPPTASPGGLGGLGVSTFGSAASSAREPPIHEIIEMQSRHVSSASTWHHEPAGAPFIDVTRGGARVGSLSGTAPPTGAVHHGDHI